MRTGGGAKPPFAAGHAGTRDAFPRPGGRPRNQIQVSFSYWTGLAVRSRKGPGRAPSLLPLPGDLDARRSPHAARRWVGSGRTMFNNKGKPVREYEPFFSDTHEYELGGRPGSAGVCSTTRSSGWSPRCIPTTATRRWSSIRGARNVGRQRYGAGWRPSRAGRRWQHSGGVAGQEELHADLVTRALQGRCRPGADTSNAAADRRPPLHANTPTDGAPRRTGPQVPHDRR